MGEEDGYLKKEKQAEPEDLRKTGVFFNLLGNLGKYGSLMLGVYGISKENWTYVLIGGAGYFVSSFSEFSGNLFGFRGEGTILAKNEGEINRKLDLLEKRASGRSIGTKILDPNKTSSTQTRLDDMVRKDLEKEGISSDDNTTKTGWKKSQ